MTEFIRRWQAGEPPALAWRVHSWACYDLGIFQILGATLAFFQDLQLLPQFDHAAVRENATKVYARIYHAVAADYGAGVDDRVAADFRPIADNRPEFSQARRNIAVGCDYRDFAVIELHI